MAPPPTMKIIDLAAAKATAREKHAAHVAAEQALDAIPKPAKGDELANILYQRDAADAALAVRQAHEAYLVASERVKASQAEVETEMVKISKPTIVAKMRRHLKALRQCEKTGEELQKVVSDAWEHGARFGPAERITRPMPIMSFRPTMKAVGKVDDWRRFWESEGYLW